MASSLWSGCTFALFVFRCKETVDQGTPVDAIVKKRAATRWSSNMPDGSSTSNTPAPADNP